MRGVAHPEWFSNMSNATTFACAAFILTGGASTRMGADKALLELEGVPLLLRTANLLAPLVPSVTVVGAPERYARLGLRVVADDAPGLGPLGGIATAVKHTTAPWNLVVACDLPYLTREWLDYLVGRALASTADAVLPQSERGDEPLCAVYHQRCASPIARALVRGVRKVTDGLADCVVEKVLPAEWKPFDSSGCLFKNMNTPEDYAAAREKFARQ
jgi:molybdopterin-guanine dinucleotide biosynthesis protein A